MHRRLVDLPALLPSPPSLSCSRRRARVRLLHAARPSDPIVQAGERIVFATTTSGDRAHPDPVSGHGHRVRLALAAAVGADARARHR